MKLLCSSILVRHRHRRRRRVDMNGGWHLLAAPLCRPPWYELFMFIFNMQINKQCVCKLIAGWNVNTVQQRYEQRIPLRTPRGNLNSDWNAGIGLIENWIDYCNNLKIIVINGSIIQERDRTFPIYRFGSTFWGGNSSPNRDIFRCSSHKETDIFCFATSRNSQIK